MQWHKIVARIVLLIFSLTTFALAAPVLVRGMDEVRVDVVEVADIATTASQKRRNPLDGWRTNAADRANTPRSLGSRDLTDTQPVPAGPGSPPPTHDNSPSLVDIDSNAPQSGPNMGSKESDNPHPLPLDSPLQTHNKLPLDIDLNHDPPQPSLSSPPPPPPPPPPPLPPPRYHNWPLDIDLYGPQPNPGSPPPPAHHNWPLDIDLNATPQPSQEPTDNYDSANSGLSVYNSDSSGSSYYSGSPHVAGSETSSDVTIDPSAWYEMSVFEFPKSPSRSPSQELNPPRLLDIDLNRPPLSPGPTDDNPPLAQPSNPGSSKRPYVGPSLDPGSSKRPYRPLDPGPSTWAYRPSDPGTSTWAYPPQDPGPSTWAYPPQDPGPSTWAYRPSDPGPSTWTYPPQDPGSSTWAYRPSDPGTSTWAYPPQDPGPSTWAYPPHDSGTPIKPYLPSDPKPSTSDAGSSNHPSDSGPSTFSGPLTPSTTSGSSAAISRPPSNPGILNHESEIVFSDLLKGKFFKRRISRSRSVDVAKRELQG